VHLANTKKKTNLIAMKMSSLVININVFQFLNSPAMYISEEKKLILFIVIYILSEMTNLFYVLIEEYK
jgi:hypothetical protein